MTDAKVTLEAQGLVFRVEGRALVAGFDAAFRGGEVHAIVGPNGAGKTTVLRMLAGLAAPTVGQVVLDGRPIHAIDPMTRARRLSLHLEVPDGAFAYSAREVVAMGRFPYHADADAARRDAEAIDDAIGLFDLASLADRPYPVLSAGEKQRVSLARTFAQTTPLVLLDEPLARLDPYHVERVAAALRGAAGAGRLVIAIVHELDVAARVADVIHVLKDGHCVASGAPGEVLDVALIRDTWGIEVDFLDAPALGGTRRVIAVRGPAKSI